MKSEGVFQHRGSLCGIPMLQTNLHRTQQRMFQHRGDPSTERAVGTSDPFRVSTPGSLSGSLIHKDSLFGPIAAYVSTPEILSGSPIRTSARTWGRFNTGVRGEHFQAFRVSTPGIPLRDPHTALPMRSASSSCVFQHRRSSEGPHKLRKRKGLDNG